MASNRQLQPLFQDANALPSLPPGWQWKQFQDLAVPQSVGKKYENKTVSPEGEVPVIDQSADGVIGYHNDTPGVEASSLDPVFTFANHTCVMRWMAHPFSCIQNVFVFRAKSGVHLRYLFYAAFGRVVLEEYKGHAPVFRAMYVPLAPEYDQRAIAQLLNILDARIDLLRQTNATLESIAQALFKSWLIDFDPVRAKAEGREPEGMDAATAALFPAELEDSALGLIPKGWSVCRLSDLLELSYGKALKATDRRDGQVPVYGSGGITGFHDEALVQSGAIIVGRKGTVGSLYWEDRPFFPIDTTFYVKPKTAPMTFCFYALQRLGLESMNTDAAVPGLNRENAYRLELTTAPSPVLVAFDELTSTLRSTMRCNDERAVLIASLRDSLLPRLISGRLRLPEAKEQVEEVLA